MNKQQIFDKVVQHFVAQVVPARDSEGHCKYRSDDGKKCAVGCLIADHYYRITMEGLALISIRGKLPQYMNLNFVMLDKLQIIHDNAPKSLKTREIGRKLVKLAREFNLSDKVVRENYKL